MDYYSHSGYDNYYDYYNDSDYYTLDDHQSLRIIFTNEVYLAAVKLMPYSYYHLQAESICVYAGQTGTDSVGCIYDYDEFDNDDYTFLSIESQMIPTQQILIEFNISSVDSYSSYSATLRELQVDYFYKG